MYLFNNVDAFIYSTKNNKALILCIMWNTKIQRVLSTDTKENSEEAVFCSQWALGNTVFRCVIFALWFQVVLLKSRKIQHREHLIFLQSMMSHEYYLIVTFDKMVHY